MSTFVSNGSPAFLQNDNLQSLRKQNRFDGDLRAVQRELRVRRKTFLGSHLSLRSLVYTDGFFDEQAVKELSRYLSKRTVSFWGFNHPEVETFCFRFYVFAITAITYKRIADECVDDILQFANCLVNSKQVFSFAMEGTLPEDMREELSEFVHTYTDDFYKPSFVDAVLGAICVLLGVIADPLLTERSGTDEEN